MYLIYLFCVLFTFPLSAAFIDLEESCEASIVEIQRIEIPEYPHAFNPSIVKWKGRYLLSFRVIEASMPMVKSSLGSICGDSLIGLVWLDDAFKPIGTPQILNLSIFPRCESPWKKAEEGRLFVMNDRLYLIYADNKEIDHSPAESWLHIAELGYSCDGFKLRSHLPIVAYNGASVACRQKNWVPFAYQGDMYFGYTLNPHRIFRHIPGSHVCEDICSTYAPIHWPWGQLRGGTPALLMDDGRYLAFFHSSKPMTTVHSGVEMLHYFMGAYTFSSSPPFALTHISAKPIVGKGFYSGYDGYEPYWGQLRVVFPCGILQDDHFIWVSYGRQDHEMWIVKFDKQRLLESLAPIAGH